MSGWFVWRLLKFTAVLLVAAGATGAVSHPDRRDRVRAVYLLLLPGFLATSLAGYAILRATDRGFEPWVLTGLAAALVATGAALRQAHAPALDRATVPVVVGALGATTAEMVLRPTSMAEQLPPMAFAAVAVGVAALAHRAPPITVHTAGDLSAAHRSFAWLARLESLSLVSLLALSVAKRGLGLDVSAVMPLLGWLHGMLFLLYGQVLVVLGRAIGWSWGALAAGVVAGLVPFGAFAFERFGPPAPAGVPQAR